jgi:Mannosyl-glycoprotein endo-beta-N-acetylglucosaminidase
MSSVISYEVNQQGGGRWWRTRIVTHPGPEYQGPEYAALPLPQPSRSWANAAIGMAVAVAVIATALLVTLSGRPIGPRPGLSSYAGAGSSDALAMGMSGVDQSTLASAPPPTSAPLPTSTPTAPAATPVTAPAASANQRQPAPGDYNLLGRPSINVATIEQVLKQFNSPAVGNGQTFYDLGVKYGVDPAFMLAFFVHESAAGTAGAAVATMSVGNIICAGWSGACIGRFRAYNSYAQAAEDWYQLITGPLYIGAGLTTPDQITPRYAPSSDNNDPNGYAKTVERLVDQWRAEQ